MFVWGLQRDNENLTIQTIEKKKHDKILENMFFEQTHFL